LSNVFSELSKKVTWNKIVEGLINCIDKERQRVLGKTTTTKKTIQTNITDVVMVMKEFFKQIEARILFFFFDNGHLS